jgi:hypothetical protein
MVEALEGGEPACVPLWARECIFCIVQREGRQLQAQLSECWRNRGPTRGRAGGRHCRQQHTFSSSSKSRREFNELGRDARAYTKSNARLRAANAYVLTIAIDNSSHTALHILQHSECVSQRAQFDISTEQTLRHAVPFISPLALGGHVLKHKHFERDFISFRIIPFGRCVLRFTRLRLVSSSAEKEKSAKGSSSLLRGNKRRNSTAPAAIFSCQRRRLRRQRASGQAEGLRGRAGPSFPGEVVTARLR